MGPTMAIEPLKNVHQAQPFRLHLADGRDFVVPHRDFLSHSPNGRTAIVYGEGDAFSIIDMLLVTEIEVLPHATTGA